MSAYDVVPGDAASSVVLHVSHSSTAIPADVREGIVLSDADLAEELQAITDADTDRIALQAAEQAGVRPWVLVNRASRLVDPERFPDEREELNAVGMGAVYERTTTGAVLRTPTETQRQRLIDEYFTPYSEAIAALVRDRFAAGNRSVQAVMLEIRRDVVATRLADLATSTATLVDFCQVR